MSTQPSLFDITRRKSHGSGLSDEANLLVPKSVDRMLVLAFIKEERRGRTLHEIAFLMGKQVNSVSPRITELLKGGLIVRDGRRDFHGHAGSIYKLVHSEVAE
jgi:hypothetical protein